MRALPPLISFPNKEKWNEKDEKSEQKYEMKVDGLEWKLHVYKWQGHIHLLTHNHCTPKEHKKTHENSCAIH